MQLQQERTDLQQAQIQKQVRETAKAQEQADQINLEKMKIQVVKEKEQARLQIMQVKQKEQPAVQN